MPKSKIIIFSFLEILWQLGNLKFPLISCRAINFPVIFQLTESDATDQGQSKMLNYVLWWGKIM